MGIFIQINILKGLFDILLDLLIEGCEKLGILYALRHFLALKSN